VTGYLDFGLDGLDPADVDSAHAEGNVWKGDLTLFAEHYITDGPDRSRSFLVAHDESVTRGVPGSPRTVALAITRDRGQGTFTFAFAYHASHPFAQAWLIARGCPPGQIALHDGIHIVPADETTRQIEEKIRSGRYTVLDTHTRDYASPYESWTLARDTTAPEAPVRIFLEQDIPRSIRYTVREGAFPDADSALAWLADRSTPLPHPPEQPQAHRAAAARSRSARPGPTATTGHPVPPPGAQPRSPSRSR
jgi:hypothetical protein